MSESRSERVIQAVKALVQTALPGAEVKRNRPAPERTPPGGHVDVMDGEQGEPEVTLSPYQETYAHIVPLTVTAPESLGDDQRHAWMNAALKAIADAVEADRTLGGLTEWLRALPPEMDDAASPGGGVFARVAELPIEATYTVAHPLGA